MSAAAAEQTVRKSEFAAMCGVSPAAVSQWIRDGKITADALDGQGRSAKIRVGLAKRQVSARRDVGQALGNGITTRVDEPDEGQLFGDEGERGSLGRVANAPAGSSIEARIKQQRLEELERRNRQAAREELESQGVYVRSDQVSAAFSKMARDLVSVFEGSLVDLASAISGQFKVPQREVLHLLTQEMRKIRVRASEAARKAAEAQPALITDEVAEPDADELAEA